MYLNHLELQSLRVWSKSDNELLNFYSKFIKADDLVFDIGANIGTRVKIFLKLGANVVAFEPQPDCINI